MRKTSMLSAIPLVLALALVLAGIASADHHAIKVSEEAKIGKFLVDAKGMTLYIFKKDSPGKSACAGPCVEKWPLYYREAVAAPSGLKAEDFAAITREDGKKQTTYKGWPLYYFARGQEFRGHRGPGGRGRLVRGGAVTARLRNRRFLPWREIISCARPAPHRAAAIPPAG